MEIRAQQIVDIPPIEMDLPPALRPYDTNAQALIPALEATEGRATVAFKAPGRGKTITTAGGRRLRAGVPAAVILQGLEALVARGVEIRNYHARIGVASVTMSPELAPAIAADPLVDWLEPSTRRGMLAGRDRLRDGALNAISGSQITPWGVDSIKAPQVWGRTTGDGVKILIIDGGYRLGHQDLPADSTTCVYGLGDGGCVDNIDNPSTGHATAVMGVAVARNNSTGVVGVAPGVDDADAFSWSACEGPGLGDCDFDEMLEALDSAAVWGVQVVNMSFTDEYNATHAAAIHTAADSDDMVLVAAAGNVPACGSFCYPAGYSDVIGVSGVNDDLSFADPNTSSNCGGDSESGAHVEISAPYEAYTTVDGGDSSYGWKCGTSFATPHVTGVAALLRAQLPSWSSLQVFQRLLGTARDLGPSGWDSEFGYGLVDAVNATGPYVSIDGPDEVQPDDDDCEWSGNVRRRARDVHL